MMLLIRLLVLICFWRRIQHLSEAICLTLVSIRVMVLSLHTDTESIDKTTRSLAHIFYHYDCYLMLEFIRGYSSLFLLSLRLNAIDGTRHLRTLHDII